MECSPLMRIPPELRHMIYAYLFDDGGRQAIRIETVHYPDMWPRVDGKERSSKEVIRTRYYVTDTAGMYRRRSYSATYGLACDPPVSFCVVLMRVNRAVYNETSYLMYGGHSFDFGADFEAVKPFFTDLTAGTRSLVRSVSLCKKPLGCGGCMTFRDSGTTAWRSLCTFLAGHCSIRKLRLVVRGGRPALEWPGPKELAKHDFEFLASIQHPSLDWVAHLAEIRGIEELEVVTDMSSCPVPVTSDMLVYAACSASIESGFSDFLREKVLHQGS